MPATLPARANLEYLKKQSKDLRRAFAEGEADAVDRIRRCLPRAGRLEESQLGEMDLSLQETQHALACEYGFGKWEELVAAVEAPGFDDLARLNDRETQILMREVDQNVLVRALVGAAAFRDLAVLARQKSLTALASLVVHADDPVLAAGLDEAAKPDADAQHLMSLMGQRLQEERVALHRRHCLVIKGIAGIQAGKDIDVLVAEAKRWAEEQAAALAPAPTPSPTTPL